jgi:hypothetical protein
MREFSGFFRASVFPADRYGLYAEASHLGAPEAVLQALHRLPAGREFTSVDDVWSVLAHDPDVQAHVMPPEPSGPAGASSPP